jgi:hypothetical protein
MDSIRIKLRFPEIGGVSDRTLRSLLKDLSKVCRGTQARELDSVMKYLELNRREQQSIRDRVSEEISGGPAYYIKNVRTGSIEIVVVLSTFSLWLLQNTIGETFKESWKQSKLHKGIVKWVASERETEVMKIIKEEAGKLDFLSGRAVASSLDENKKARLIEINLQTSEYAEIKKDSVIDDDEILRRAKDFISKVE